MENDHVNVFVYSNGPRSWMAYCPGAGIGCTAASRDEALAEFSRTWNSRGSFHVVEGAPPRAGAQANRRASDRAAELQACHAKWTQRLEVSARDGMVELLSAAVALDELLELATK
jgi:hypothetical protein